LEQLDAGFIIDLHTAIYMHHLYKCVSSMPAIVFNLWI